MQQQQQQQRPRRRRRQREPREYVRIPPTKTFLVNKIFLPFEHKIKGDFSTAAVQGKVEKNISENHFLITYPSAPSPKKKKNEAADLFSTLSMKYIFTNRKQKCLDGNNFEI